MEPRPVEALYMYMYTFILGILLTNSDGVSSKGGYNKYQPIRAQQILSRPIRIEYFTHVTY